MKKLFCVFLFLISSTAFAKLPDIVAVVNDRPITLADFEARKKMVLIHNNIDVNNSAIDSRLNRDVLNTLIEEELLNQHAEKVNGTIGEAEVLNGISIIEERNNMPKGHLLPYLQNQGININSFKAQLKGELIKYNIVNALSNSVSVSPKEFDVAIINAAAKDFDIKAWIFTAKNNDDKTYAEMQKLRKQISCKNTKKGLFSSFAINEQYEGKISYLPPKTQTVIQEIEIGTASTIYTEADQFKLALLCDKKISDLSNQDQTQITAFLSNKKMSKKAEKFFRDMRAKAYIKIYLPK
jgi:hypothetical protein